MNSFSFIKFINKNSKIYPELTYIYPELTYKMKFSGNMKNNPGFGYAAIYCNNQKIWKEKLYVGNSIINNYSEYACLLFGIKNAIKLNIQKLFVIGKNNYVINEINEICNNKIPEIVNMYNEIKNLENKFISIKYSCVSYF